MNRFIAEFRYKDLETIHTLWKFSNMATEIVRDESEALDECSIVLIIDEMDRRLEVISKFCTKSTGVRECCLTRLPRGRYNLKKLVRTFDTLRKAGSGFFQVELKLGLSFGTIRDLLNEYSVGYTLREKSGNTWYPAISDRLNKNLKWYMSYNSNVGEISIWATEMCKEYQVFIEPNKFKKNWRNKVLCSVASIISKSYSSG